MKLLIVFMMSWACVFAFVPKLSMSLMEEERDEDNFWKIPKINLLPRLSFALPAQKQTVGQHLEAKTSKFPLFSLLERGAEHFFKKLHGLKTDVSRNTLPHGCHSFAVDDCSFT